MTLLEACLNSYLAQSTTGGTLQLDGIDKVEFGKHGGVLGPGHVLLEVRFGSKWMGPILFGERELREAEMRGYERAVNLLRQTGREDLANELDRAYMGLQKSLPPVAR